MIMRMLKTRKKLNNGCNLLETNTLPELVNMVTGTYSMKLVVRISCVK